MISPIWMKRVLDPWLQARRPERQPTEALRPAPNAMSRWGCFSDPTSCAWLQVTMGTC